MQWNNRHPTINTNDIRFSSYCERVCRIQSGLIFYNVTINHRTIIMAVVTGTLSSDL